MTNTGEKKGHLASATGFANENRLLAALLSRGYNASKVDLPLSTYDILLEKSTHDTIRVQVKTVAKNGSISFRGGVRGGADRSYKSDVKGYTQSTDTSDVVVGVYSTSSNGEGGIDFYIIPTLHIEKLGQKSISINKVEKTKNNWKLLMNCKDENYVSKFFGS